MNRRNQTKRILLVEDEDRVRDSICAMLRARGFTVVPAADGRSALREVERVRPDVVLTDLFMPELDGIELIGVLQEIAPEIPIIAMSTRIKPVTVDYIEIAMKLGAVAGFYKPLDEVRLLQALDFALLSRPSPAPIPVMAARVA